tara:strand:+ start:1732 stop:2256 length:525 start_codon:yes stop_codon:yes gene_type:complete
MITTEGPFKPQSGVAAIVYTNDNNGNLVKNHDAVPFKNTSEPEGSKLGAPRGYNVGYGSTMPTAAWVDWTAAECDIAGVSTAGMDPLKPESRKTVQINVPASNIATVREYGSAVPGFRGFNELYEGTKERHERHDALRAAGYTPPFPRADRFYKNKHQNVTQVGLTTSPSYKSS